MHLCLFEDGWEQNLAPLASTRPVFELVCGRFSARERLVRAWNVTEWGVIVRPYLAGVYREEHPEARLNDAEWLFQEPVLMINGRWIPGDVTSLPCTPLQVVISEERPVAIWVLPDEWRMYGHLDQTAFLERVSATRIPAETPGTLIQYPWDLVAANREQLRKDFRLATLSPQPLRRRGLEVLGEERLLAASPRSEVEPFVAIDLRQGPVTIEDGVKIRAFSRIEGPCHLGRESTFLGGQLTGGTTIGPHCVVTGEIENSILQSHVRKSFDGFLGHSYLSPWSDLGAGSGTIPGQSGRMNVTAELENQHIKTPRREIGAFLGDHVRTLRAGLFDAGALVGPMATIHAQGQVCAGRIPAFSSDQSGQIDRSWPLEILFDIARAAMRELGLEFTTAREMLFRLLSDQERSAEELYASLEEPRNHPPFVDRSAA
jgi:UDP-N-acetylglucosamine diphosphorylase / glucose-1-phosphate thymidylyltransferase / UDP-N-acetylgalactosamine diphosphorylase / glucosamine-1-phosphate N-acetyltransferase / galactosamine-1-phosphate N-acetyltransferase